MDETTSNDGGYEPGGGQETGQSGGEPRPETDRPETGRPESGRAEADPGLTGSWVHRVVFATRPGGAPFAFRPGEVLSTGGEAAVDVAKAVGNPRARLDRPVRASHRIVGIDDPLRLVAELRMRGFVAQLNHVFFAHSCGCGCGCGRGCGGGYGGYGGGGCPPHPAGGWGSDAQSVHPTPYGGQSVHPTPYGGQSVHPTPYGGQSVHPTPYGGHSVHPTPLVVTSVHPTPHGGCGCCPPAGGPATQSVHPTPYGRTAPAFTWPGGAQSVHPTPYGGQSVHPTPYGGQSVHPTPFGVTSVHPTPTNPLVPRRSSARPVPSDSDRSKVAGVLGSAPAEADGPRVVVLDTGLATGDQYPPAMANTPLHDPATDIDLADITVPEDFLLDEVAGHGTFIAGLVQQVAPGTQVTVHKVLATVGDTDEERIVQRLQSLTFDDPMHTVLSLSFGGYVPELPLLLAGAIADIQAEGVVVVASAGNDGTCEPMFPAALPGVVSVGAVGPDGPAPFTNYGPWVRACAPGVDLMSTFFQFTGATMPEQPGRPDPDNFDGWALWSGTSFSAPVVAGALARTMIVEHCDATEAVTRVVDNPSLLRIPGLGTVVNVV